MKHNSRASMSHNVEYRNYGGKNLYRLCSPYNPDLAVIRDYLKLFQNRSADFNQIKIVCKRKTLTHLFMLNREWDFSRSSLSIVRYDGLDVQGCVSSFDDPSVDEICRVCYSQLRSGLINDWILDSAYIYRSGGSDFGSVYSHDFIFERSSDRS